MKSRYNAGADYRDPRESPRAGYHLGARLARRSPVTSFVAVGSDPNSPWGTTTYQSAGHFALCRFLIRKLPAAVVRTGISSAQPGLCANALISHVGAKNALAGADRPCWGKAFSPAFGPSRPIGTAVDDPGVLPGEVMHRWARCCSACGEVYARALGRAH